MEYDERLQAALRRSSDVAIIFDPKSGEILFVSPSCEHVTGYKPQQLIGTNGWDYVHPEDRHFQCPGDDPGGREWRPHDPQLRVEAAARRRLVALVRRDDD
jgi:PAS domain-containing protein